MRSGLLDRIRQALYEDLIERGQVKLDEWNTLGSFLPAQGGRSGRLRSPGQGEQGHGDRGPPWSTRTRSTSSLLRRRVVALAHGTLDASFGFGHPARLMRGTADDSDGPDEQTARGEQPRQGSARRQGHRAPTVLGRVHVEAFVVGRPQPDRVRTPRACAEAACRFAWATPQRCNSTHGPAPLRPGVRFRGRCSRPAEGRTTWSRASRRACTATP